MHLYADPAQGEYETSAYPIREYGDFDAVRFSERAGGIDEGLAALDEAGMDYAAVLGSYELPDLDFPPEGARHWPEPPVFGDHADALREYNRWLCGLTAVSDRLLPFVTVNPAVMGGADSAAHVDELIREHGARGMKLHPIAIRTHADDPALQPVFAVAQDAALPIVLHSGPDIRQFGWSMPRSLASILDTFPRLPLVLAHLGGAAWAETAEIAAAYPAAWFDLSEVVNWIGAPEAPSSTQVVELIRAIGVERVVTGSDFPWYDPAVTVEIVESLPGLDDDDRRALLGENAARLIGLA
jgi:predicted TIM-barrel fold metal-dependent hydrolase